MADELKLTEEELAGYSALQDRVYAYAEKIAVVYAGLRPWEFVRRVKIENELVHVSFEYSDSDEGGDYYFPAAFLTKPLEDIRVIAAMEEQARAMERSKSEYEQYLKLKKKFEKKGDHNEHRN